MRIGLLAASALVAGCLTTSMPGESFRGELEPATDSQAALARALRGHVVELATRIGERHTRRPRALEAAAQYIERQWTEQGYAVAAQPVDGTKRPTAVRNLEVELPGRTRPSEIIVVGAHYDSAGGTPGADDNASGVAGLLELSRILRQRPLDRTVRLVAFVNEEPPYFGTKDMGSAHYAKRSRDRGDDIVAMYSLEMLGYYSTEPGSQDYPPVFDKLYPSVGNFIAFIGNVESRDLVAYSVQLFRRSSNFPSEGASVFHWIPGVSFSDQMWFWKYGYHGVMVTDTAFERNKHYHKRTDTPDRLDYDRMARVVEGLVEVVAGVANQT